VSQKKDSECFKR